MIYLQHKTSLFKYCLENKFFQIFDFKLSRKINPNHITLELKRTNLQPSVCHVMPIFYKTNFSTPIIAQNTHLNLNYYLQEKHSKLTQDYNVYQFRSKEDKQI